MKSSLWMSVSVGVGLLFRLCVTQGSLIFDWEADNLLEELWTLACVGVKSPGSLWVDEWMAGGNSTSSPWLEEYQGKCISPCLKIYWFFSSSFPRLSHPLPELLALSAERECQGAYLISSPLEWSERGKRGGQRGGRGLLETMLALLGLETFPFLLPACLPCLSLCLQQRLSC